ncbi:bifunctional thymidylate/uridylate kinase [Aspergillus clavatus NRRL 1]|uniref:Thymidylate kinase n=1 Tax=Aspergillus clavatus (strain ATCC 1007 / CBS 513.65 / DSM 816 / NCTC 3887 / NRRL 1 / QM 1276 / 107) TaxID=344612 RepID=A1C4Z3_ASPCL|nr:thymidylate kinase [Aspergillus clavatus NRRL 1]EAW14761.1 thymidylate kinase [Aspergillus clavatus NRRL 1]
MGNMQKRGALIVVEGLDRAGKSSQCERLRDSLQASGYSVKYIRFPDRTTPIGQLINGYLQGQSHLDDHSIHLLFSANRWEIARTIENDIANGVTVIVDRYSYSGAVYSAAKGNQNLSLEWAWQPEIGLPQPDICLFLRISPEEAAKRGGFGIERYENEKMQSRVRELFQTLFKLQLGDYIHMVDAGRTLDAVSQDILQTVTACLETIDATAPLKRLGPIAN